VTVAAVVLAPSRDDALAVVGGVAAIRRIADLAWAGGALPVVIVPTSADDPAVLSAPLSGASGVVIATVTGNDAAIGLVRSGIATARQAVEGTDAVLIWPGRYVHIDAETVTSLIEAHGVDREVGLVPAYEGTPGWPLLLPVDEPDLLDDLTGGLAELAGALRERGLRTRLVELGDPGIVHDLATAPGDLPPFAGPAEPAGSGAHDWGERVPANDPSPAPPAGAR
jgi:CTP:molybdopterin cytidylyltransferase MocA